MHERVELPAKERDPPLIVAVRDSKDPAGPKLTFAFGAWILSPPG